MTETEAIKGLLFLKEKLYNGIYADRLGCIDYAVYTLKEIQQYREIGTVKECRELASIVNKVERNELAKIIDEWINYSKIGTVEECREAMGKQNTKVLEFYGDNEDGKLLCPNCGEDLWELKDCGFSNCPYCGQAIS